jgi:hypothetical protein
MDEAACAAAWRPCDLAAIGVGRASSGADIVARNLARVHRYVTGDPLAFTRTRDSDTASLPPTEFIGRFLQHILPSRFVKIRHFGLMASGNVNTKLECARALVPATTPGAASVPINSEEADDVVSPVGPIDPNLPWPALLLALTGQDVLLCPRCQQRTIIRQPLPPARAPPEVRGDA